MKIAYLGSDFIGDLDFETPTCLSDNPADRDIDGGKNMQLAILEHSETLFYSLTDFTFAFNNDEISDLGMIALCEDDKKTLIY
jgi:hypothetical protein